MTCLQMTPPQARTPRFQAKREALLDAAARLFNKVGVKGATLADIAEEVGLVTTSVTYYYRRKENLVSACFLRAIEDINDTVRQALREPTMEQRLQRYFLLHADKLAASARGEHPDLVQFNDLRALSPSHFKVVSQAYTDMFRNMRELMFGPATSALSRPEINARTHYLLSLSNAMRAWLYGYDTRDYWRLARHLNRLVLHGLAAADAPELAHDTGIAAWQLLDEPDSTAEAFLRAASELVNEQGYRGASVNKISARLNVTKGAFYHHNNNKEDLILQCFERTFGITRRAHELVDERGGNGWQRTAATIQTLTRFQLSAHGPMLRLGATSAISDDTQRRAVLAVVRQLTQRLAHDIVDGMVDGSIRAQDPILMARVALSIISSVSELTDWVADANEDNVAELYIRPLLHGVLCPRGTGQDMAIAALSQAH